MTNPIEERENQVEALLGEALRIARKYNTSMVGADHFLFVLSGTEEGRRAIESMGGHPSRIRTFLERIFGYVGSAAAETETRVPATPEFADTVQQVINKALTQARANNIPVSFRDFLHQMVALKGACETTRRALVEGGILERDMPQGDDDYRLEEEVEEPQMDLSETQAAEEASNDEIDPDDLLDDNDESDALTEEMLAQLAGDTDDAPVAPMLMHATTPEERAAQASDDHERAVWNAIRDLVAEARAGKIDEVIARDDTIDAMVQTIGKRRKPNVLLVGEAGTGKTAIAEGFALKIARGEVPTAVATRPVWDVSLNDLVSGSRYRGDFEARMSHLVRLAQKFSAIVFFDEVHMLMGAGAVSSRGGMDAANILKPALARGGFSVVGATTPSELRALRKNAPMMRRFEVIVVKEPDAAMTREIIDTAVAGYVLHHEVMIEDDMLDKVVEFADRYMSHKRFPDKAFDLIDSTLSIAAQRGADVAEMDDLRSALARLGGVRLGRPDAQRAQRVLSLETALDTWVKGQKAATSQLAQAAMESTFGLQAGAVAASYLLNGPSGVGKSEMVRAYAATLGLPLIEISLSEFIEKHSVARLIGAPPGYVGFDEEGLLTAAADSHTEAVLFLDEADKATPEVFDILLQVLDRGVLRAGDGREVSMRGMHIFLASNFGAEAAEKPAIGFGRNNDAAESAKEAIKGGFRKEFLARIRHVIQFQSLDRDVLVEIARDMLAKSARRLTDAGYEVSFAPRVEAFIVDKCDDIRFASRSIEATIGKEISGPLARRMLEASSAKGFRVDVIDGAIAVEEDCDA